MKYANMVAWLEKIMKYVNVVVRLGAKTMVIFAIGAEGFYHDTHAALIALALGLFILVTTKEEEQ